MANLFALPDTGALVDLDSLPENVIDGFIQKYGGQPNILARKTQLEQSRIANQPAAIDTPTQIQQEVAKRTGANLQSQLNQIFGDVQTGATNQINDEFGDQRRKLLAEEAAVGRFSSPAAAVSAGQVDKRRDLALSDTIGKISAAKASGQLDVSKTIEGILQNQRGLDQQNNQFGQTLDFGRSKLISDINQSAEDRGLSRYLADFNARNNRDNAEPDQYMKQLGRINGTLDTFNKSKDTAADLAAIFGAGSKKPF